LGESNDSSLTITDIFLLWSYRDLLDAVINIIVSTSLDIDNNLYL
jgi:hypothetical protein